MTFTVGLPTLPNMFGMKADGGTEGLRRLALWPLGIAATGFGGWAFFTQAVGMHVTECGFDAQGAYADVRVNNLLGGEHEQPVVVWFFLDGESRSSESAAGYVQVPAHGQGAALLRGGRRLKGDHNLYCAVQADDP